MDNLANNHPKIIQENTQKFCSYVTFGLCVIYKEMIG